MFGESYVYETIEGLWNFFLSPFDDVVPGSQTHSLASRFDKQISSFFSSTSEVTPILRMIKFKRIDQ